MDFFQHSSVQCAAGMMYSIDLSLARTLPVRHIDDQESFSDSTATSFVHSQFCWLTRNRELITIILLEIKIKQFSPIVIVTAEYDYIVLVVGVQNIVIRVCLCYKIK